MENGLSNGNYYVTWPKAVSLVLVIILPLLGSISSSYFLLSNQIDRTMERHKTQVHEKSITRHEFEKMEKRIEKLEDSR